MDPNIVNSASFGLQWKVPFNKNEQVSKIPISLKDSRVECIDSVWDI